MAIRAMDEHWDGGGYPTGLRRDEIPLYARIVGLAQVVEIYWRRGGVGAALEVARERRGRWFDPALVKAFCSLGPGDRVWSDLHSEPLSDAIAAAEPIERAIPADESRLDSHRPSVCPRRRRQVGVHLRPLQPRGGDFGRHRDGHERIGAAARPPAPRRAASRYRQAVGAEPGSSTSRGSSTADEWEIVKRHPYFTHEILARVPVFSELAYDASCHHERIDGRGYHRGGLGRWPVRLRAHHGDRRCVRRALRRPALSQRDAAREGTFDRW